ncbi:MAG: HAMP domain-containing histidine kinase, partial [Lachnospiraceae bacterium]|nr:HAMP domain-containing histidine kinase [Lachnospiraceae bacterium]
MINKWNWNSIYFRLIRLLASALICSGTFFFLSDWAVERFFGDAVRDSFQESQNERNYEEFQKYVTDNHLSSKDTNALNRWARQHRELELEIYKNYALIYDSMDPGFSERQEEGDFYYTWQSNYVMTFKDGRAQLVLYGFYVHRMEIMLILLRVTATFVIFLLIFFLGIRSEIRYISELSREVAILEGGDLNYPITVRGKDELSFLASSIDSMRLGIREEIRKNKETTGAFREVITEMSHDLRTPLTSLLLYAEILENARYEDAGQWKRY